MVIIYTALILFTLYNLYSIHHRRKEQRRRAERLLSTLGVQMRMGGGIQDNAVKRGGWDNMSKEELRQLKKKLVDDWGTPCPSYSVGCYTCEVWRAYDVLASAYDLHRVIHEQKWAKPKINAK